MGKSPSLNRSANGSANIQRNASYKDETDSRNKFKRDGTYQNKAEDGNSQQLID